MQQPNCVCNVLGREVTLDGPDAQLAFDGYMGEVRRLSSLQIGLVSLLEALVAE
jgi:hypothetical protein